MADEPPASLPSTTARPVSVEQNGTIATVKPNGNHANLSKDNQRHVLELCNHDIGAEDPSVTANGRKIEEISEDDQDRGRPLLDRLLALAKKLYEDLNETTDESRKTVSQTWLNISDDKKKFLLKKAWYVPDLKAIRFQY